MTDLAPERASLGVTVGGTAAKGLKDAKPVKKRTQKEITCDDDTAVRRMGLLEDADLNLTFLYDPADTGQQAILASDSGNTQVEYIVTKGSMTFTATAGISQLSFPGGPADEQTMEVQLSVSGGIVIS
jgi:hypothetical protein